MLIGQFYSNKTNQPEGDSFPVTSSFLQCISDSHHTYRPNQVLSELRQGFAVQYKNGFYMAEDNGKN